MTIIRIVWIRPNMSFRFMELTRTRSRYCGGSCGAARSRDSFPSCRRREIGIQACGASHHWARLLRGLGHAVLLGRSSSSGSFTERAMFRVLEGFPDLAHDD